MNSALQDLAEKWEAEAKEYEGKGAPICALMTRAHVQELRALAARPAQAGEVALPEPFGWWLKDSSGVGRFARNLRPSSLSDYLSTTGYSAMALYSSTASAVAQAGVPEGWREDVHLAAQMLTWGRDEGLTESQEREVDAHAAKLFAMLAAAPQPRAEGKPGCIWPDCGHDTNRIGYGALGCDGIGCPKQKRLRELAAAEQASYVGAGAHGIADEPQAEGKGGPDVSWIDDTMSPAHLIDQVRMRLGFGRIEDDEAIRVLEIALARMMAEGNGEADALPSGAPYADEMTNGECADKLQAFLDVTKENDPEIWPRGIVREVERAVYVLRNPPRTPFICECKWSPTRGHNGRGGDGRKEGFVRLTKPAADAEALAKLISLIRDDGYAMTHQTMEQYRTALLRVARRLAGKGE